MTKPYLVALGYSPAHGFSSFLGICSNCGETFTVYVWSFHGTGKKCPKCGVVYGAADVREPAIVKHEGRWLFQVGERMYDINGVRVNA